MEAPASITCPECRARWQRYHDEHGRAITHTPVGYLKVFLGDAPPEGQPVFARSYADLRAIVLLLEEGSAFRVILMAGMIAVGRAGTLAGAMESPLWKRWARVRACIWQCGRLFRSPNALTARVR